MTIRPFPFGFIYSSDMDVSDSCRALGWNSVSLPDAGQLWVSDDHPISSYFGTTFKTIWIGYATTLSGTGNTSQDIAKIAVEKLEGGGWNEFHKLMDKIVGRFVAFIWEGPAIRVYHDATAIRPVYFNSSDSLVVSHAPLLREVRQRLGRTVKPLVSLGQHKLWEETEDPDISALPANFYLDIQDKRIRRFYPHSPISTEFVPARERICQAKYLAQKSMKFWGSLPLQVYCALTGGLDTRMNTAAALGTGLQIKYVTYGRNSYYLGRASSNLELFVAINNGIIENVPIGLRSTPYHFHIEGLNTDDLIQAGIRATVDMGTAWIAYSIVDLLEWTESPETSESKLSIGSTKTLKNVEA